MPVAPPGASTAPGITLSALDFIKQALRANNVLASGEEPKAAETSDCLSILNQQMDAWNAERLMIWTIQTADYPLVPGQQTYTLGTGGNFNQQRPQEIERVSVMLLTNPANPLELGIDYYTTQDWQENVPLKSVPSTFPLIVYDDGSWPFRNLSFWPIPQVVNNVRIYYWSPISYFANTSNLYTFPYGYPEAIWSSLAIRLAANGFGAANQFTIATAQQAVARIKTQNVPTEVLRCEDAVTSKRDSVGMHNYRSELFGIP